MPAEPTQRTLVRHLLLALTSAVAALVSMCLLPYPEYLRYFEIVDDGRPKPPWIYHRIHEYPGPIHVAFFGTSRTDGAVDSLLVEEIVSARLGRRVEVVNFAVQRTGRNMHHLLARELLFAHPEVELVFFEMGPLEDRLGHPQFINLADPEVVLEAPLLMNLRYFEDLIRLPGREAFLFMRSLQIALGLRPHPFAERGYDGSNFDRVESIPGSRSVPTLSRDVVHSREELDAELESYRSGITPNILPKNLSRWEWRMDRQYVDETRRLVESRGATFAILYLPFYRTYELPAHVLERKAEGIPVVETPEWARDYRCWLDIDHLNSDCGMLFSWHVGGRVVEILRARQAGGDAGR